MDLSSPKECPLGFLRAQFKHVPNMDGDLFFYSGEKISHYTDLNGLYGIVESGGFWLSDHRFLNDLEEFENGRQFANNLLIRLRSKERDSGFIEIINETLQQLSANNERPYYVCSFSRKPDSLDQWKSYASDGQGVSITFDNSRKPLSHFFAMPIFSVSKVLYEDSEKTTLLLKTIRKYRIEYLADKRHGNSVDVGDWGQDLASQLALEFISFKHSEYSSEQEVRMAVSSSHLNHFNGIKHRVGKDRIIPYITSKDIYDKSFEKHVGTKRLPILEVRVGPTANQSIATQSIEEYLICKGYENIKVISSDVPYRG